MSQVDRVLQDLVENPRGFCARDWYRAGIPNARNRVCTLEKRGAKVYSASCWLHDHGEVGEPPYFAYRIEKMPRALFSGRTSTRRVPQQLALLGTR